MRTSSKILAFIFFIVAGGLVYFVNKADEDEINTTVEERLQAAFAEREQALNERADAIETELAERQQALEARLDSALTRQEQPIYSLIKADSVESALRRMGLAFERSTDDDGDPKLSFKLATYNVTLFFYSCQEDAGCESLRLYAGFDLENPPTTETINEWNRTKRYSTAYLNDRDWACLDEDLRISGGVSLDAVEKFILNYRERLTEYARHIGA